MSSVTWSLKGKSSCRGCVYGDGGDGVAVEVVVEVVVLAVVLAVGAGTVILLRRVFGNTKRFDLI